MKSNIKAKPLIEVSGLGPIVSERIIAAPSGGATWAAPSGSGKSHMILALTWALWGIEPSGRAFDVERIGEGMAAAEVTVTLGNVAITRHRKPKGRDSRMITRDGRPAAVSTQADLAAQLGLLGDDAIGLLVAVPMRWQGMTATPAAALQLRDLLIRLSGVTVSTAAIVDRLLADQGDRLDERDDVTPAGAAAARTAANKDAERAAGAVLQAERALADAETALAEAVTKAQAAPDLETVRAETHAAERAAADLTTQIGARDALQRHASSRAAAAAAVDAARARLDAARARVAEASARADELRAAASEAREQIEGLRAYLDDSKRERDTVARRVADAQTHRQNIASAAEPCSECGQPVAIGYDLSALDADISLDNSLILGLNAEIASTKAKIAEAQRAIGAERDAERDLERAHDALNTAASGLLLAEKAAGETPDAPAMSAADAETLDERHRQAFSYARQMRELLQRTTNTHDRVGYAELFVNKVRAAAADAQHEHEHAMDRQAHAARVLDAVRRAPGEIGDLVMRALGLDRDGPVWIQIGSGTGDDPAVEIFAHGRPWRYASRGEIVHADAVLRDALRRCLVNQPGGDLFDDLPILVDDAQCWAPASGDAAWPHGAILLVTAA